MTLATSIAQIRALGPCADGYRFALTGLPKEGEVTAAQAREAGCSFEDMAWYLSIEAMRDHEIWRRLQHWKADCATRVLPVFEAVYPLDSRARNAIIAVHAEAGGGTFAQGCPAEALAAENQAWADGNVRAAQAAAAARTCGDATVKAAWACAHSAVEAVRENREAELAFQYDRLVEWFTGDGPEPLRLTP